MSVTILSLTTAGILQPYSWHQTKKNVVFADPSRGSGTKKGIRGKRKGGQTTFFFSISDTNKTNHRKTWSVPLFFSPFSAFLNAPILHQNWRVWGKLGKNAWDLPCLLL
jgi:hypothetical protein